MMQHDRAQTAMAAEIREIPLIAARLLAEPDSIAAVADRIRHANPRVAVISGRGSSGNAGTFLRYLFETRAGLLVSTSAPSVVTTYRRSIDMRDAIFIVISQSGRSPDLVAGARSARESGALTIALVNDVTSPVAEACELTLPIGAGPELAVAATKSVLLSMVISAQLVASLTADHALSEKLEQLPQRFSQALGCDWSAWSGSLAAARAAFVIGRGFGLGPAREIALKIAETMRLPTLSYSAAEVRHGPLASASAETPLLVLRQNDGSSAMVDALIAELRARALNVFSVGDPDATLPWIGNDDPICDAMTMLLPAYATIEQAARDRGFDPDNPPHLTKITETL
ncbi:MAG TPA: SIS domain-containing protein [Bradyrhizobium sp.]|nr:SIS domain-containing protein [Bradyrhizobium sp.]